MPVSLIQLPALSWSAEQQMLVSLSPLYLPAGRQVTDWSTFTLTIRSDPLYPRTGSDIPAALIADPVADGWPVATTAVGSIVNGVVTFSVTVPTLAGVQAYAVDVVASGGTAGRVQLVKPRWLTVTPTLLSP